MGEYDKVQLSISCVYCSELELPLSCVHHLKVKLNTSFVYRLKLQLINTVSFGAEAFHVNRSQPIPTFCCLYSFKLKLTNDFTSFKA